MAGKSIRKLVLLLVFIGIASCAFALTNQDKLNLLEEKFLKGDISEKTYLDLKKKYEGGKTEVVVPSSEGNLVKNPGFEETTMKPDIPDNWIIDPWNTGGGRPLWKLDTTVTHSGKNSAYIKCPAGSIGTWEQEIKLDPNKTYVLKVWVKAVNAARVDIVCDGATRDGKRPVIRAINVTLTDTFDWTQITLDRIKPNPGTQKVMATLVNRGPGEVWFDDVELVEEN